MQALVVDESNITEPRASLLHRMFSIIIVVLGSLFYILYLFPLNFLDGTSSFWESPPIEDVATQISGLRYYISDQWRFPLFRTYGLDPPDGISIIYTDSLPIFAVFAKILYHVFGTHFNYFGLWIGLCYILQAISAVVLLASLGVRGHIPALAAAGIALSMPSFLFRLFHPTLCAHFLIMLALSFYFTSIRTASFHRVWPWFCVLAWVSLWVQAYIFVMVSMILFGTAIQVALAKKRGWLEGSCAVVTCGAGALCVMWASGYFWGRYGVKLWEIGTTEWFGWTSMNLLSPVVPQWSGLFQWSGLLPDPRKFVGATAGPYREVAVIDATGGQYEGFNYLGAGVLLLVGVALWLDRRNLALRAKKYWGLLAALFVLTALATTHRVYVGSLGITLFDRVPLVLEDIRSSGRLFWPVGYTVMAASIAVVAVRSRRSIGVGLLLGALVLQVGDTAWLRYWARNWATQGYAGSLVIPATPWVDLIRQHHELKIFPTSACAAESKAWNPIADLVFYASESLTPVNTAANDRSKTVDCRIETKAARYLAVGEKTLVVMLDARYVEEFASGHPEYRSLCRSFDRGSACSRQWPELEEMGFGKWFSQSNLVSEP
jgi:hypothetical protein